MPTELSTQILADRLVDAASTWWPVVNDKEPQEAQLAFLQEVGSVNSDGNARRVSEAASRLRSGSVKRQESARELVEAIEEAAQEQLVRWASVKNHRADVLAAAAPQLRAAVALRREIGATQEKLRELLNQQPEVYGAALDAGVLQSELARAIKVTPGGIADIMRRGRS